MVVELDGSGSNRILWLLRELGIAQGHRGCKPRAIDVDHTLT